MGRPPSKPAPIAEAGLRARVVRPCKPEPGGPPAWYWRASRREGGAELTIAGRRVDGLSLVQRETVRAWLQELATGGAKPKASAERPIATVADLLDAWMSDRVAGGDHLAERSLLAAEGAVTRIAGRSEDQRGRRDVPASELAGVLVSRLQLQDLEAFVRTSTRLQRRATSTVHRDLKFLSQAWAWGRRRGLTPDRALDLPTVHVERIRPDYHPTADDLARVLEQLRMEWERDVLTVLWWTGMRIGELAVLLVSDADLSPGREALHIPDVEGAKTGARTVPLMGEGLAAVRRLIGERGPDQGLVPVSGNRLRNRLGAQVRAASVRAGVPPFVLHGIRGAYVDRAWRSGMDPSVLPALLGHSAVESLKTYRQVRELEARAAMAATAVEIQRAPGEVRELVHPRHKSASHDGSVGRGRR